MKKIMLILSIWAMLAVSVPAEIDSNMDVFSESVASINNVVSGFVNPAGLGISSVMALRYVHAYPDTTFKGDNGLLLATHGTMASVQWLYHTNDIYRIKYLFASGKQVLPDCYWGVSMAYFRGAKLYKGVKVWNAGVIYGPFNTMSFGFVIDDINEPEFADYEVQRNYTVGAALKIKSIKTIFSIDSSLREREKFGELGTKFRLEVNPFDKVIVAAQYNTEGRFQIGLIYDMESISVGGGANFRDSGFRGGNLFYNQYPVSETKSGY